MSIILLSTSCLRHKSANVLRMNLRMHTFSFIFDSQDLIRVKH